MNLVEGLEFSASQGSKFVAFKTEDTSTEMNQALFTFALGHSHKMFSAEKANSNLSVQLSLIFL